MTNRNKRFRYFLSAYDTASFMIKEKAKLLLYFLSFGVPVFIVMMIVLNMAGTLNLFRNSIIAFFIITLFVSLLLLKKGVYNLAANCLVVVIAIGLITILLNEKPNNIAYVTNFFYLPAIVIFAALFCKLIWMWSVTLFFMAAGIFSFFFIPRPPIEANYDTYLKTITFDFCFAIFISAFLCALVLKVNKKVSDAIRMESEKVNELNRELEQRVEARTADYKQLLNKIGDGSITIVKPPEE